MNRFMLIAAIVVFFFSSATFAQDVSTNSSTDVGYWVNYWSQPRLALFGSDEEAFNQAMLVVFFPWVDHSDPSNPAALDSNAEWLKAHPNVRFYIDGYASSRGTLTYNLALSQRRADWVRQALISRGVASDRIKLTVGWGQLYPVCADLNDNCWAKNRLVRFQYAAN